MYCWGFPLLAQGICQNNSYILRQWLGTSLESGCSSTPSIIRTGNFREEQGIKLCAWSLSAVNLSSCTTVDSKLNLLSFFQKYSRPEKLPGPHPTPNSPVVSEKEHANICMCLRYMRVGTEILPWAIIEWLWLFLNYIFQASQSLHFPKSTWYKSNLSCKEKKSPNVGDFSHGFAYLDKPEMVERITADCPKNVCFVVLSDQAWEPPSQGNNVRKL